jgi:diguanylate cyclase (GGDEF)-like protein
VTVVFVVFAEEYQRGSPWLNVLAAQIAMLSLVFSVPVIALAVNGMRREAKRAAVALELAQRDSLTGLYNRRALNRIVDGALARAAKNQTQVGIVYLDIDKFKALNDALGHGAGDLVLAGVGKELRDSLRQTDSAFRVGGDEFVVVLSDLASASDLDAVVDSVRSNVNREFAVGGRSVSVSVSLGSALGYGSSDRDGLLAEADRALYQEKEFGPSV